MRPMNMKNAILKTRLLLAGAMTLTSIASTAHAAAPGISGGAGANAAFSLTAQPAFVLGRRWDVLAWNRAAEVVYGPYGRLEGDERNMLHMVFADPDHRRLLVDWEAVARSSLAMFRADCARYAGDPDFERLVARLTRLSPEFSRWWPRREVARPLAGQKRIDHPTAGRMLFEYSSLGVGDPPDMKLIVFTPLEDEGTIRKLERLLRDRPFRRQEARLSA